MPTFHQAVLPSGLTLLAECDPEAHTSAIGFFVRTGARDEDASVMGVSHFLEHMMFKGTDRRSADDINREFDELGANYNAFTSHENTVYFAQVLPEFLPRAVDLLSDMLRPALRESDFSMEKNVILEEIGMYEDQPTWRLSDAAHEAYYGRHPLGFRVLGTKQSITGLSVQQMHSYFRGRYASDNITVAAAGRIAFDRLAEMVGRATGHWRPSGPGRELTEQPFEPRRLDLTDAKLNRHYLSAMCPGPSAQDPARYAAQIAADVLGDSDGSRLYWALIDPGLAEEADLSFEPKDGSGVFSMHATCDPRRAAEVERVFMDTIDRYAQTIDPSEIERAQNKIATSATVRGERPMGRMMNLGSQWTYLRQYTPLEVEIERIMSVTTGDVSELLRAWPMSRRTIATLGPGR